MRPDARQASGRGHDAPGQQPDALFRFCAKLKQLQRAANVTQTRLAEAAHLSTSQVSDILNGKIRQPPDWGVVDKIVRACLAHAKQAGKPLPYTLHDEADWRRRYGDLEQDFEAVARPRRRTKAAIGQGVSTVRQCDPFDLEVHRVMLPLGAGPSQASEESLTPYLKRHHDHKLCTALRPSTAGGPSALALLVGDSCTGKTRALYEALRETAPDWPLLRPADADELLEVLQESRFQPGTVLWLNETQRYMYGTAGERAATLLRSRLMAVDGAVAVGAIWGRPYFAELTAVGNSPDIHAAARALLDGPRTIRIDVEDHLTGHQQRELIALAPTDKRLEAAVSTSGPDGDVIQHLTGGPELLHGFINGALFTPVEEALLTTALDARRLGHLEPIPITLLAEAADGYLSPRQRPGRADWATSALAGLVTGRRPDGSETGIRNALTALKSIRARSGDTEAGYEPDDYLDQHTRRHRQTCLGPPQLWDALAVHATTASDLHRLGRAAYGRGLYWHAALLWKRALTLTGDAASAVSLFELLLAFDPDGAHNVYRWVAESVSLDDLWYISDLLYQGYVTNDEAFSVLATRAASQAPLNDVANVAELLGWLIEFNAREAASVLAVRAGNEVPLDAPTGLSALLDQLHDAKMASAFSVLAVRAANGVGFDDLSGVAILMHTLIETHAIEAASTLAARAAVDAPLGDSEGVADLISALHDAEAYEAVLILATRAANGAVVGDSERVVLKRRQRSDSGLDDAISAMQSAGDEEPIFRVLGGGVVQLLSKLREIGAHEAVLVLAARAARDVPVDDSRNVAALLRELADSGTSEAVSMLLSRRPADHAALDDLSGVAALLSALYDSGADEEVSTLLTRFPAEHVPLNDLLGVSRWLRALRYAGADQAVSVLTARAARDAPLEDPFGVARLLTTLRYAQADTAVSALLARHPGDRVALGNPSGVRRTITTADVPFGVAGLLRVLRDTGALEAALALTARAANDAPVDDPVDVLNLLSEFQYMKAGKAYSILAARAANGVSFNDFPRISGLLKVLRYAGADEAVSVLAARAADAGLWELAIRAEPGRAQQYKFGRQPDGAVSASWKWVDLADLGTGQANYPSGEK